MLGRNRSWALKSWNCLAGLEIFWSVNVSRAESERTNRDVEIHLIATGNVRDIRQFKISNAIYQPRRLKMSWISNIMQQILLVCLFFLFPPPPPPPPSKPEIGMAIWRGFLPCQSLYIDFMFHLRTDDISNLRRKQSYIIRRKHA